MEQAVTAYAVLCDVHVFRIIPKYFLRSHMCLLVGGLLPRHFQNLLPLDTV